MPPRTSRTQTRSAEGETPIAEEAAVATEEAPVATDDTPTIGELPVVTDPWATKFNPNELPAVTAVAQQHYDMYPDSVDAGTEMDQERQDQALANIQSHVDEMAERGVIVTDARLPDTGPPPDPTLTSLDPESSVVGPPDNITLKVIGDNFLITTQIAFGVFSQEEADLGLGTVGDPKWERTTFVDKTTLTTIITAGMFPNPDAGVPVTVGEPGGSTYGSASFAFTEPVVAAASAEPEAAPEEGESESMLGDGPYASSTKAELQQELEARGLHTSGNKEDLIARLEEDDAAQSEEEPS